MFVRHGYSCQNSWKTRDKAEGREGDNRLNGYYPDPELTTEGIELCEARRKSLEGAIHAAFPDGSYKIGTSCLIRTQQTAYYMLLKDTDLKYSIFPHIAENADKVSNYPLPLPEQKEFFPPISTHLHHDKRGSIESDTKSNWNMFLDWVASLGEKERNDFFYKTDDGAYRAVIFTHYEFIEHALGEKLKPANNDVFLVNIDTNKRETMKYKHLVKNAPVESDRLAGCRIANYADFIESYIHSCGTNYKPRASSRKFRKIKLRNRKRKTRRF